MPIAIRSVSSFKGDSTGTFSVTKPAGTAVGDVLFAFVNSDDANVTTVPTGWTRVSGTGAATRYLNIFSKVITSASEPTSYSFSVSATVASAIVCLTGVDTTNPVDVAPAVRSATTAATTNVAPTITPVTANAMLLTAHVSRIEAGTASWTPPTGMTEQYDSNSQYACLSVNSLLLGAVGATGTKTATSTRASTTSGQTAASIVVRPAAVPLSTPGTILGISTTGNKFSVQVAPTGAADIETHSLDEIAAGYTADPYFVTTPANNAVQFWARVDAPPTSGTTYSRSELRENNADGSNAGWNANAGTHEMSGTTKITHLPPTKPEAVIAQVHNGASDRIAIRTQLVSGTIRLRLRINGSSVTPDLASPYAVGTEFSWKIRIVDGAISVFYNDMVTPVYTAPAGTLVATTGVNTWYFKAGLYNQSDTTTDVGTEYGSAELRSLGVQHSAPTSQDFSGSLALSGSGDLTELGTAVAVAGSLGLSGSGNLVEAGGGVAVPGALALAGSGTQTRAGKPATASSASTTGSGTLTLGGGSPAVSGSLALSGAGTQTRAAGSVAVPGSLALGASGGLLLSGAKTSGTDFVGSLILGGTSTLSFSGAKPAMPGTLARTGSGSLVRAGQPATGGSMAPSGAGSLALVGGMSVVEVVSSSGVGTLELQGVPTFGATLQLGSVGMLALAGGKTSGKLKIWTGTTWRSLVAKIWTGTTWRDLNF